MTTQKDDHIGKKFFIAIQNQDFDAAAEYLITITRARIQHANWSLETLSIFLVVHLASAFDLAGLLDLSQMQILGKIMNEEFASYDSSDILHFYYPDVIRSIISRAKKELLASPQAATDQLKDILNYIDTHLSDSNLSEKELCLLYDCSPSALSQRFQKETGSSLSHYIRQKRFQFANRLLEESDLSIKDIAKAAGYDSANSFIRSYKKEKGRTPGEYRRFFHSVETQNSQSSLE